MFCEIYFPPTKVLKKSSQSCSCWWSLAVVGKTNVQSTGFGTCLWVCAQPQRLKCVPRCLAALL